MKQIFVLMMVKNELDVIETNIRYLQTQNIDHFYIADNMSTDGTTQVLDQLQKEFKNIMLVNDNQIGYYQSDKMNKWARECFEMAADYVLPIDADEVWYSLDPNKTLGEVIQTTNADIFVAHSIDFVPTHNDDAQNENFIKRIDHKKSVSDSFSAVAFNYAENFYLEMGNHDIKNHPGRRCYDALGIRHYQYRSYEQFVKKVKNGKIAYDNTNFPDYMGSHWRKLGALSDSELKSYWQSYINIPVKKDVFVVKNYE
jgi:glycosyltransferase involved in cell wall biosynthesis